MPANVDELLQAYLEESRTGQAEEAGAARPRPSAASAGDLRQLLGIYLQTTAEEPGFAMPRSAEVDELLRRYVLDQEDVGAALETTLRAHVAETGSHPALPVQRDARTQDLAERVCQTADLGQQLTHYAAGIADHDEREHAFSDDQESTLKGVPPPNAPPIALGSELARHIRKKTKSGNNRSPV